MIRMNKNKTIAIVGSSMGEQSFGVGKDYLEWISQYGNPRIILPNDDKVECDMLIMQGGMDIAPSSYKSTPSFHTSNTDVFKQHFYDNKLKYYIESKTPIVSICLGMQSICTYFGMKLVQDLVGHPQSKDTYDKGHTVSLIDKQGNILNGKKNELLVNSFHHQGVMLEEFDNNEELIPLLVADDGVVEAIKHVNLPIFGVQFHPERWFDQDNGFVRKHVLELLESRKTVLSNE